MSFLAFIKKEKEKKEVFSCFLQPHRTLMASFSRPHHNKPTNIIGPYRVPKLEYEPIVSTSSSVMIHRFREGKHCPSLSFLFCFLSRKRVTSL